MIRNIRNIIAQFNAIPVILSSYLVRMKPNAVAEIDALLGGCVEDTRGDCGLGSVRFEASAIKYRGADEIGTVI